jgi:hypothetical protein
VSAVEPYRVQGGIMAPKLAEGTDAIGVLWVKLTPDAAEYRQWDRYLRAGERRAANTTKVKGWLKEVPR